MPSVRSTGGAHARDRTRDVRLFLPDEGEQWGGLTEAHVQPGPSAQQCAAPRDHCRHSTLFDVVQTLSVSFTPADPQTDPQTDTQTDSPLRPQCRIAQRRDGGRTQKPGTRLLWRPASFPSCSYITHMQTPARCHAEGDTSNV